MRRRLALLVALGIGLALMALGGVGWALSRPALSHIGAPPAALLPAFRSVSIPVPNGAPLAAWFGPGRQGAGAVLLLHGIRGSRLDMVARARLLAEQGYSVLLADLPAHGESLAEHITYGLKEAAGVAAAFAFLGKELPGEKLGVIGVSLGAASLVFATREAGVAPGAIVLESMYPTIEEAVQDRLRLHLGSMAGALAPLLLWQLPVRLGITAAQLRPIDVLPTIHSPLLIVSGAMDRHTVQAETERLYAAANEPKALWIVDGAAHVDLHAFGRAAYETKVFGFLGQYLRAQ